MDAKRLVRDGYEVAAARYDAWSRTVDAGPRSRHLAALGSALEAGARVLELGCGTGLATAELAKAFTVVGVDFAAACLGMARAAAPSASYVRADMTNVAFRPASFDAVVAFYSMIHVPRSEQPVVLRNAARWLQPGGILLVNLATSDAEVGFEEDWRGVPMYWSSFDSTTNLRMVEEARFTVSAADEVTQMEDSDPVTFLWILARNSHGSER